ncbi:sulfurtransferase TusA family protein [Acinetobacter sp. C26M]|uniref:sulfurtransferase TusA family protein n=1 Tax=unclassified Acinetobacter TaxID=196816 RepID=UPI00141E3D7E|nr:MULTISPECIES: sulfurtransferase TusA family protein [unclassified Acinetobacter]NIE94984.1 sulfurtransferase TusA family protein [Acinetobacter sp. Tr-809]USA48023.1 sulfurtransferase TusA family protein [Acinetobacter sp. C26M]USA51503.1 sulfurtransferase TusA family protein [Acinetobacter sp. C26G]
MTDTLHPPIIIDALGQPCPMPLLMLKRALKKVDGAQQYLLKSSDPHSEIDVTRYCKIQQLQCLTQKISDNEFHYLIESM